MAKEFVELEEARAFVEANYQGDPLIRHMFGTLLDKLPRVEAVPVRDNNVIIQGKQPVGAMSFCYACPKCANIGSDLCEKCRCEVEGGFSPKIEVETRKDNRMKLLSKIGYFGAFLLHGAVLAGMGYGVATWEFWALTISMCIGCFASILAWGNW